MGGTPIVYYFGLFGDMCVTIYCFCSGYAQCLISEKEDGHYTVGRFRRIFKFISHFWLIIALFSLVAFLSGRGDVMPGNLPTLIGNILLYRLSYNGAWWFVVTYIFLLLLTPLLYRVLKKMNPWIAFLISGAIYFVAYVFRFLYVLKIENTVLSWVWWQSVLLGTSQFPFVLGMLFYKYNLIDRLRQKLNGKKYRPFVIAVLPVLMFLVHCKEPSLIIAPITGIVTLTCFHLWNKPKFVKNLFLFMGRHSTNIWLTHMFFYSTLFEGLVFAAKYPIPIFLFMVVICIAVSYAIDYSEKGLSALKGCFLKK